MSLFEKIKTDMYEAMKLGEKIKSTTLRTTLAKLKDKKIAKKDNLSENEEMKVLQILVKQRSESIELYEKGNRPELKDKEIQEMKILQAYLPEQVSEKDLRRRIQEVIDETGAEGMKDFGKIMKTLVPEFKGKADNSLIKELANEYLN